MVLPDPARSRPGAVPLALLLVLAAPPLAGCLAPTDGGARLDRPPDPVTYAVQGCTLFEAVVPGDMLRTEAALPAGFSPVDYGTYWGGPPTGDSALSAVWFDCERFAGPGNGTAATADHAEVFLGAYVTVPVDLRSDDTTPFYLFETLTTNADLRALLAPFGWRPPDGVSLSLEAGAADRVQATAATDAGSMEGEGAFPAGDQSTGTFTFHNFHTGAEGLVRQRLDFQDFAYRTAPVTLQVDGIEPLASLVEEVQDGQAAGLGFFAADVTVSVRVEQVE